MTVALPFFLTPNARARERRAAARRRGFARPAPWALSREGGHSTVADGQGQVASWSKNANIEPLQCKAHLKNGNSSLNCDGSSLNSRGSNLNCRSSRPSCRSSRLRRQSSRPNRDNSSLCRRGSTLHCRSSSLNCRSSNLHRRSSSLCLRGSHLRYRTTSPHRGNADFPRRQCKGPTPEPASVVLLPDGAARPGRHRRR